MTACCRWRFSTIDFARIDGRSRARRHALPRLSARAGGAQARQVHVRIACKGIEFIEFCASEEEAHQLGQMLRTLGFAATHRHVRKAVTRWRQGDINIVVNCEPDGFAHSYDTVHGASVCAIGLRVADPDAALRRAQRLQIPSFSQPVDPGEYEIPALRGVGGSLLYFMKESETPSIWKTSSRNCRWIPRARRGSRAHRSFLAEHAIRGDAFLAALLRDVVSRSRRARRSKSPTPWAWYRARRSSRRDRGCASC